MLETPVDAFSLRHRPAFDVQDMKTLNEGYPSTSVRLCGYCQSSLYILDIQ